MICSVSSVSLWFAVLLSVIAQQYGEHGEQMNHDLLHVLCVSVVCRPFIGYCAITLL